MLVPAFCRDASAAAIAARAFASERRGTRAPFGCLQSLFRLVERRRHLPEPALGRAAEHRLLAGRFFRCSLRAVAAVERVVQRQSIVALADGVVRVLQRLDGGLVLLGRIAIGACGARGVDRTLGLIHFARRRCGARDGRDEHEQSSAENERERRTTRASG